MAACKPAPQCALILPSGKRCGSPALRNQRHCHFHRSSHCELIRERLASERLDGFGQRLDTLTVTELLMFLHEKLCMLLKTMSRFPEVSYTLTYTLDRLAEIRALESGIYALMHENQEFASMIAAKTNELMNLHATDPESRI